MKAIEQTGYLQHPRYHFLIFFTPWYISAQRLCDLNDFLVLLCRRHLQNGEVAESESESLSNLQSPDSKLYSRLKDKRSPNFGIS